MQRNRIGKKRCQYDKITIERREHLIELVLREGLSVKQASQKLNLKYSTAKHIFHFFKLTGQACTPEMQRRWKLGERSSFPSFLPASMPSTAASSPVQPSEMMNANNELYVGPNCAGSLMVNLEYSNCWAEHTKAIESSCATAILPYPISFGLTRQPENPEKPTFTFGSFQG